MVRYGYGSIPINTIFSGMNIHLLAILMWTTGVQGFDTSPYRRTIPSKNFRLLIPRHHLTEGDIIKLGPGCPVMLHSCSPFSASVICSHHGYIFQRLVDQSIIHQTRMAFSWFLDIVILQSLISGCILNNGLLSNDRSFTSYVFCPQRRDLTHNHFGIPRLIFGVNSERSGTLTKSDFWSVWGTPIVGLNPDYRTCI